MWKRIGAAAALLVATLISAPARAGEKWLASSDVPKLDPGILITPAVADWCRKTFRNIEVEHLGPGIHYVQEDHPEAIGDRVKAWRKRKRIA